MRRYKLSRRIIPFNVFRKMKPNELKAVGAKVQPPLFLNPSDKKPTPSEAPIYYQLHEAEADAVPFVPKKRLLGFREWCHLTFSSPR